jgi:type VI secretion system secreted protein Hcp
MAIYMDYPGIKGSSAAAGYANSIVLNSFQFGAARNITMAHSTGAAREVSAPTVSQIMVTKSMDIASPKLFTESVAGNLTNTVKIHFTTTTANKVTEFLVYTLANAGVASYSVSVAADGIPSESLGLSFTQIEMKLTGQGGPDVSGSPATVGYDLTQAKTV